MLTAERLREVLEYHPDTGLFTRKVATAICVKVGDVAGTVYDNGYVYISVDSRKYGAHRLAWLFQTGQWPKDQIDHINGVKTDNRFGNLRQATSCQNVRNVGRNKKNTSGFKGVCLHNGRWRAALKANRQYKYVGYFDTPEEAYAAYCTAAKQYHGEFARVE